MFNRYGYSDCSIPTYCRSLLSKRKSFFNTKSFYTHRSGLRKNSSIVFIFCLLTNFQLSKTRLKTYFSVVKVGVYNSSLQFSFVCCAKYDFSACASLLLLLLFLLFLYLRSQTNMTHQ